MQYSERFLKDYQRYITEMEECFEPPVPRKRVWGTGHTVLATAAVSLLLWTAILGPILWAVW